MKQFTVEDLVSFGNYLLSKERFESIINSTSESKVTDADLSNWNPVIPDLGEFHD